MHLSYVRSLGLSKVANRNDALLERGVLHSLSSGQTSFHDKITRILLAAFMIG